MTLLLPLALISDKQPSGFFFFSIPTFSLSMGTGLVRRAVNSRTLEKDHVFKASLLSDFSVGSHA